MLKLYTLALGEYQTNCHIVHHQDHDRCAIIDPGCDASSILQALEALGMPLDAILLTHGHFDHVVAVKDLVAATGCKLYMSKQDFEPAPHPMNHFLYPLANDPFAPMVFCQDGDKITAGGLTFDVLATPGHTWGSLCFRCGDAIFTGDTLFARSCGRIDLPGGNQEAMSESLARLKALDQNYTLYPGHGSSTTLSQEKLYNPYLR